MINEIKVIPGTTASDILFFSNINLNDLPDKRIVPLYGANGSGKTTLLKEIQFALYVMGEEKTHDPDDFSANFGKSMKRSRAGIEHDPQIVLDCDKEKTVYYKYRNGTDNFQVAEPRSYAESFDPMYITYRYNAQSLSEGQSLVYSVDSLLKGMLKSTRTHESFVTDDSQHTIVLLDELDSGLSIDNLDDMLKIIRRVLGQGRPIQFVMSFNNPYVVKYFPYVVSMYDGKIHKFDTSDDMLDDLINNRKMLDKARKSRGQYKIF